MKIVFGLGNIGKEYESTRHNAGAIMLDLLEKKINQGLKIKLLLPGGYMNHSGKHIASFVKTKKDLENLIVVYDDVDLPLGKIKISFNRGSGGHNGIESIIKSLKSREFIRIRIGISKSTPTGKTKKPQGEEAVLKFLLSEFKETELAELKKLSKSVALMVDMIYTEGKDKAMTLFN